MVFHTSRKTKSTRLSCVGGGERLMVVSSMFKTNPLTKAFRGLDFKMFDHRGLNSKSLSAVLGFIRIPL